MDKKPDEITPALLSCIVMPTGEILCLGKTIGRFERFKTQLKEDK